MVGVERLAGGSKKGVYRLAFDDGATAVGYVWAEAENYWPAQQREATESDSNPFADASGAGLFQDGHALLEALGVRTPRIYVVDRSQTAYPADIALVQDVRGGTLETQLERDLPGTREAMTRLRASLQAMHQHRSPCIGKIGVASAASAGSAGSSSEAGSSSSCEQIVLDRALGDLAEASTRVARIAAAQGQLENSTRELAAAVRPRAQYRLIHGELGPDHVLIDDQGHPVLIDIEGLMFFDVEWEHAFLQLRFGNHYPQLHTSGLDDQRLRFYGLALHLSLIAGPLRLLDGDFPDREPMLKIAEFNTDKALAYLR
jgi:hypothetical protein